MQQIMMLLKRLYIINWLKKLKPLILVHLLKKTDYDVKIRDIEGIVPNITSLGTTVALIAVENEIQMLVIQ